MSRLYGAHVWAQSTHLTVSRLIQREFGAVRGAPKILGRLAACSYRTAQKWLQGRTSPSARHIERLMAHPRFADNLRRELEQERCGETTRHQQHEQLLRRIEAMRAEIGRIEAMLNEPKRRRDGAAQNSVAARSAILSAPRGCVDGTG